MSMDDSAARGSRHTLRFIASQVMWLPLVVMACAVDPQYSPPGIPDSATPFQGGPRIAMPGTGSMFPQDFPGLRNLVAYEDGFISGSMPEGEVGFDSLASLGVRTIVSVDGAIPDVESARERGMRYVHLPIGYDGFDDNRRLQLTRAVVDGREHGGVYIHCHHGMHRSAGAAAAVAVVAGWSGAGEMIKRMKVSGASPEYRGLYLCVHRSKPVDAKVIDSIDGEFPEVDRPNDFVEAMLRMERAVGHLELIADADWQTPESHPDLVPAAEAGQLADLLRVASGGARASGMGDPQFSGSLVRQSRQAADLERLLLSGDIDPKKLDRSLEALRASCISCHADHRDR